MAIHRLAQMMWDVLRRRTTSRPASKKGHRDVGTRLELTYLEERTLLATASGTIIGNLFIDANRNGIFDAGERAMNGVNLRLNGRNNGVSTTAALTTDANGHYRFDNVPTGHFTLSGATGFIPNFGLVASTQFGGFTAPVNVTADQTNTRDLAFRGIAPVYVSLRQFIHPITTNTTPFGPAGSGQANAQSRGNNAPTLNTTRQLYGTTSSDLTIFAQNGATSSSLDLSGFFSDADFTNSTIQLTVSVGTTPKKTINVTLFDDAAPQTVANFFNYILANRYDSSVFHRFAQNTLPGGTLQNFVLQGGGFTVSTTGATTLTDLSTNDPAVQNEFSADRSNTVGTLAMAKLGDDPNSATSEFFFNLNDNTSNLNNQNEGFTVFGQLTGPADRQAVNDLLATTVSTPQSVTAKVDVGGVQQIIPFDTIPLVPTANTSSFPTNANRTDFIRVEDVKVTNRTEFFHYKVLSVKALTGTPADLVTSATIKDNRLNILTKAGTGTGEVEVTVRAFDRLGAFVDAKFKVKVGAAPVANSVSLSSTSPTTGDTLVATVNAPALAGLPATFDFVWKVNDVIQGSATQTTGASGSFDLSKPAQDANGNSHTIIASDSITVVVTPHLRNIDGAAVSTSATVASPNPNAPAFTSPNTGSVAENTTTVTFQGGGMVAATDPNADPVSFTILGGLDADKFNLTSAGVLTFKTAPDFDTPGSAANSNAYQVVVKASDGINFSTQTITVNVTNAPVTFSSPTTAIVAENTTKVLTVVANSSETGSPTYKISSSAGADNADAGKFNIDANTGALSFEVAPDFEPNDNNSALHSNEYKVQVTADDGKGGTQNQNITVTVTNAGVQFTSPNIVSVPQNTKPVLTVVADSSEAGTPTLTLSGGADMALFDLTAGALSFKTAPMFNDPGHSNNYTVIVSADDLKGGTATQTINISVTNAAVMFTSPNTASVVENTPIATKVLTVAATTTAPGATVTFALGGPDSGKFNLAANGDLTFLATPDFDAQDSAAGNNIYTVVVTADDGMAGTAIQTITVTVTNAVVTFSPPTTASVPENTTAVLTVVADSSETGNPTYIITGGADSSKFSIDATTGALAFKTAPNFEAKGSAAHNNAYKVDVTANDGQGGTTTQTITVNVTNSPKITSPSTVSVVENTTAVETVTTTPGDGTVKFFITGGADMLKFTINATTGALSFKTAPNFEAPGDSDHNNAYKVNVTARDFVNGVLVGANTQAITVNVINAPKITSSDTVSVAENTTAVQTVTTTPPDGTIAFSLTGGADKLLFDINSSGALTFLNAPNFEANGSAANNNTYVVEVTATDSAGGSDARTITVTVTNANDNPVFTSSATPSVAENTTAVTTVTASDQDGDSVTFTTTGGADSAAFSITTGGVLTFNTAPDFENPTDANGDNVYLVEVTASDGHGGTTVQHISVTVTNAVVTFTSSATQTVVEGNTAVTTVTATSTDGTVSFSINGGDDATAFSITSAGMLTFNTPPLFGAPTDMNGDNVYLVQVMGDDGHGGTANQLIAVTVTT